MEDGVVDEVEPGSGATPAPPPGMPTFTYGPVRADPPLAPSPAPPRGTPLGSGGPRARRPDGRDPAATTGGRSRLRLGLVLVAVLGLAAAALVFWPEGSGSSPGTAWQGIEGAGPITAPEEVWQIEVACGEGRTSTVGDYRISLSGSGGCAVAADDDQVYVATRDGGVLRLGAHARADGEVRWQTDLPGDRAQLLVLPGLVLVGGVADDGTDQVVAVDAGSGAERWRTPGSPTGWGDGRSTVVARGGLDGARFAAVALTDGADRWQRNGELLSVCPGVVLGATGSNVVAHDLTSGDRLWQDPRGGPARAACVGEEAYVVEGDQLTARTARGGEPRWQATVPSQARLDVLADAVVVSTTRQAVALARTDGDRRWTLDLEDRSNLLLQQWRSVSDGRAFVAWDEQLDVIDAASGRRLASEEAGTAHAVGWAQGLVFRVGGGQAVALTLSGLDRIWAAPVTDEVDGMAIGGKTLYLAGGDTLTAYR